MHDPTHIGYSGSDYKAEITYEDGTKQSFDLADTEEDVTVFIKNKKVTTFELTALIEGANLLTSNAKIYPSDDHTDSHVSSNILIDEDSKEVSYSINVNEKIDVDTTVEIAAW